jgi:hypothetical protein
MRGPRFTLSHLLTKNMRFGLTKPTLRFQQIKPFGDLCWNVALVALNHSKRRIRLWDSWAHSPQML